MHHGRDPMLKKNIMGCSSANMGAYNAWPVGLMFRVYGRVSHPQLPTVVRSGVSSFPQQYLILRKSLITSHLQMLKEITGVMWQHFDSHPFG